MNANPISCEMLGKWSQNYQGSPERRLATLALSKTDARDAAYAIGPSYAMAQHFSIEIPTMEVTDQKASGRCWLFAATNVMREHIAVQEAAKLGIPVVAIVDSNCNPDNVEYVIPGNDDALKAIKVVMDTIFEAVQEGLAISNKKEAKAAEQAEFEAVPEKEEDKDEK